MLVKIIKISNKRNYQSCYKLDVELEDNDGNIYNRTVYGTVRSIKMYEVGRYVEI